MQLDRTHVAIRPRKLAEIGDLALILLRRYPQAWMVGLLLGAAPWIVLNLLLLGWMPISDAIDGLVDEVTVAQRARYTWLMCGLVFLQAPLAGVLTTYFLGQAVFEHRPPWGAVVHATRQVAWRCLWVLGILRGPLVAMLLVLPSWGEAFSWGREGVLFGFILCGAWGIRAFLPFLPEILLLERCPLRAKEPSSVTARRRSRLLHAPLGADLFARCLLSSMIYLFLTAALFYSLLFVRAIATGQWTWTLRFGEWDIPDVQLVVMPLALWTVVALSIFVRFLCYLDARIRLEGWEVELAVRAEALRQRGGWWDPGHRASVAQEKTAAGSSATTAKASTKATTGTLEPPTSPEVVR